VDILSVDELMKIQHESLTNIVACLHEKKLKKQFKEIIFREFIRHPQTFDEHLNLIKAMFNNLQVEKTFALRLTLAP
jgi:hypothetical protein